jgi:hypothetical protein
MALTTDAWRGEPEFVGGGREKLGFRESSRVRETWQQPYPQRGKQQTGMQSSCVVAGRALVALRWRAVKCQHCSGQSYRYSFFRFESFFPTVPSIKNP